MRDCEVGHLGCDRVNIRFVVALVAVLMLCTYVPIVSLGLVYLFYGG